MAAKTPNGYADELLHSAPNSAIDIPTVCGRKPINSEWVGKTHPSRLGFENQGFPKFDPYAEATVKVDNLTGNYNTDSRMANQADSFDRIPEGYTWHYHQDGQTIVLVPQDLRYAYRRKGGCALIRNGGSSDKCMKN